MSNIDKQAIDFSKPLETESGEPVKHICHDVIEYKCARVCVDVTTGVVYSSPYVGLKIRNKEASPRSKLREQVESAADAYRQFDNGWISDMKCSDLSHEYLLFVKEPKNVLALLDELKADKEQIKTLESRNRRLEGIIDAAEKRIAETSCQKRLIGWRASDYTDETSDPELAKNWAAAIGVLPIFEGDVNTKLSAAGIGKGE